MQKGNYLLLIYLFPPPSSRAYRGVFNFLHENNGVPFLRFTCQATPASPRAATDGRPSQLNARLIQEGWGNAVAHPSCVCLSQVNAAPPLFDACLCALGNPLCALGWAGRAQAWSSILLLLSCAREGGGWLADGDSGRGSSVFVPLPGLVEREMISYGISVPSVQQRREEAIRA